MNETARARAPGARGSLAAFVLLASLGTVVAGCIPWRADSGAIPIPETMRTPLAPLDTTNPAWRDLPRVRADAGAGLAHFEAHCQRCHGAAGAGDGPLAVALDPAPPDWTDPVYMAAQTPAWFHQATRRGVLGGGMQRFDTVLDERALWDVSFFAWSRPVRPDQRRRGEALYAERCATCHGASGATEPDARLDDPRAVLRSRLETTDALRSAHHELLDDLDEADVAALVERLFTFLYAPVGDEATPTAPKPW